MAVIPKSWLPRLSSGCGCCSLETCCNVQGYLMLVYYLTHFIVCVALCVGAIYASDCSQLHNAVDTARISKTCALEQLFFILCLAFAMVFLVAIVANVFFLRGIFKRRPKMLAVYNWFLALKIVDDLITMIWAFCMLSERWGFILLLFVDIGVVGYMLLCAETLYHKMKELTQLVNEQYATDIQDGPLTFGTVSLRQAQQSASPPSYDNLGASSAANSLANSRNMMKDLFHPA